MSENRFYLKQNVQVEPLVDRWYAWPHLIPPATYARNLTDRHLKIMDSYIGAPQVHASAVQNPKMRGGPFIDLAGKRVDEIKALRDWMKKERADLINLSKAFGELDAMLQANARGYSLHPLYPKVPDALRGYVELFYDLNNSPGFRVLERLLYHSNYYRPAAQAIMLSSITGDDRPFVLSTPRLDTPGSLYLPWAFADERIDALFRLKYTPQPWRRICDELALSPSEQSEFEPFLTSDPPPPYNTFTGKGVRWRYFGHACILLETQGLTILTDPVLSYTYETDISRYTYADLPDHIDYVLITHNHQDHILFETLLQLRHRIRTIVVPKGGSGNLADPSLKLILHQTGFSNVLELEEFGSVPLERGNEIIGVPFFGEHCDLAVFTKLAYLVRLGSESILLAADSCNIEPRLYKHIHSITGNVSVLFLGMECDGGPLSWLYGPLMLRPLQRDIDQSRRLNGSNFEQAAAIVDTVRCKSAFVYAMGQEPWLNYIMSIKYTDESRPIIESNRLIAYCRARGMEAERLFGEREILLDGAQPRDLETGSTLLASAASAIPAVASTEH